MRKLEIAFLRLPAKAGRLRRYLGLHMFDDAPRATGRRIVICDYNALLQSVTGVLRMNGYCVFQAQDSAATAELCLTLTDIGLLVLNTTPGYVSTLEVIHTVRAAKPDFPPYSISASAGRRTFRRMSSYSVRPSVPIACGTWWMGSLRLRRPSRRVAAAPA
jgi:hypothetical protein